MRTRARDRPLSWLQSESGMTSLGRRTEGSTPPITSVCGGDTPLQGGVGTPGAWAVGHSGEEGKREVWGVQAESVGTENEARWGLGVPGPSSESQGMYRDGLRLSLISVVVSLCQVKGWLPRVLADQCSPHPHWV